AAARALGLELGATRPRALGPLDPQADLVITVCDRAHEALGPSAAPYGRALHWSVPDPVPAGSKAAFAAAAGQLADRILRVAPAIVAAAA
ncbi:MAG: ArsR family transcriptional regulator, partial [Acidimicrobiales bacterium]